MIKKKLKKVETIDPLSDKTCTAGTACKYGVFSSLYFPVFELNSEIDRANLGIQSEFGKLQTKKNPAFEYFSLSKYFLKFSQAFLKTNVTIKY